MTVERKEVGKGGRGHGRDATGGESPPASEDQRPSPGNPFVLNASVSVRTAGTAALPRRPVAVSAARRWRRRSHRTTGPVRPTVPSGLREWLRGELREWRRGRRAGSTLCLLLGSAIA